MAKINHELDLYEDVFIPPSGYKTEYIEFATYSLSLGFLSIIPALIYAGERYGMEVSKNAFQLMHEDTFKESDYYNRFHIFYDANAKPIPWSEVDVLKSRYLTFANYLLSQRCTPCSPITQKNGLFHPKFILAQFANVSDNSKKIYRLVILSRNLTFAHYYETGIILESTDKYVCDNGVGKKIGEFIQAYWDINYKTLYGNPYRGIDLDKLAKTTFELKTKIATEKPIEINLLFASQLQKESCCFEKEINESISMGGFDSSTIISMNPTANIIGTNGMKISYVCNFFDMYEDGAIFKKRNHNYWYNKYPDKNFSFVIEKSEKNENRKLPIQLHSKMYIFWDSKEKGKWNGLVYAGSANCSKNALQGRNEEVLLKLKFDGTEEDLSLPTKNTNGGSSYFDRKHTYCSDKKIKKDAIVVGEICEEDFPILQYEINKKDTQVTVLSNGKIVIKFRITNNENTPIDVGYAKRKRTKDVAVEPGETKEIIIEVKQNAFSDLIVLKKQNENQIYLDSLKLEWKGKKISEILGDLPIYIPSDLNGFIPPVHGITSAQDNVYERLMHHRLYCNDYSEVLISSLGLIEEIVAREEELDMELNKLNDVMFSEEIYEDYEDMRQERRNISELKAKGLDELKNIIEVLISKERR